MNAIARAVAALGPGPLQEEGLRRGIDPLFSRALRESGGKIYLANHSLGRPLDQTAEDVVEGLRPWYAAPGGAWSAWGAEMLAFRRRVAELIAAPGPQCVVPKASAGQGLRAVLNRCDGPVRVIATRSEFDSLDLTLKSYAERGRVAVAWVAPGEGNRYRTEDFAPAIDRGALLLVVSLVFFDSGQWLVELKEIVARARARGIETLVDLYHAAGVIPVDVMSLDVDFAIGGSYKYLRGGPGASWLFVHPRQFESGARSLDSGWFGQSDPFLFARPPRPEFAKGADGWLDATPAVLPFYQARAGQEFTLAMGVARLRAYSRRQQALLTGLLAEQGIAVSNGEGPRGAFLTVKAPPEADLAGRLPSEGVVADARAGLLRLCPDILNSSDELAEAARRLGRALRGS